MLTNPQVRAVVPPWGGEVAIDLLPLLDFDAIAAAEPTWLVGYSDTSTLMVPLTLLTRVATLPGSWRQLSSGATPAQVRASGRLIGGWLDAAAAMLIGRTGAPDSSGFTQLDALESALAGLAVPMVYDVDLGHVPPQLALVNGALATVELDGRTGTLVRQLV